MSMCLKVRVLGMACSASIFHFRKPTLADAIRVSLVHMHQIIATNEFESPKAANYEVFRHMDSLESHSYISSKQ